MFCRNCGAQIQDGSVNCPYCGAQQYNQQPYQQPYQQNYQQPYQQNYQQPYQQPYQQSGIQNTLPMNWHKFLVYFGLWAGAVLNLINGFLLLTGSHYGDEKELVYYFFPKLKKMLTELIRL